MSGLAENQKLSDRELGKKIAKLSGKLTRDCGFWCFDMGDHYLTCDDLPKNLSVLSAVEKIVVEQVGHFLYSTALRSVLFEYEPDALMLISHVATMTARKKAEACLLALEQHAFESKRAVDTIPPQVETTVVSF